MKFINNLTPFVLMVFLLACGESAEEKAEREKAASIRRRSDSVERSYQESRKRANDSLLKAKKGIVDEITEFNREWEARSKENSVSSETGYSLAKMPSLIANSLRGSDYSVSADGCQATESAGKGNEFKITLLANICKSPVELKYKMENPWQGGDPNKVKDWYMLLSMDLAALKSRISNTAYFRIEKAMAAALIGLNNDPASDPDQMLPVKFEGGEIHMNSMKSNGRSSELEFTVFLAKK